MRFAFQRNVVITVWLTGLFIPGWAASLSAQNEIGLPILRNYTPKEYGSSAQNWAVVQDDRGLIYAANNAGVMEYDGVTWRVIPVTNRSTVRSLAFDTTTGMLYAGAQGEFGCLATDPHGRSHFVSMVDKVDPADRSFVNVWRTWATADGIYFQSNTRIFRWHHERLSVIRPQSSFHFSFKVRDRIFVTQRKVGLFELKGDTLALVPGGRFCEKFPIYAMLPYGAREILIVSQEGAFLFDGSGVRPWARHLTDVLRESHVYNGIPLDDSTFALATLQSGILIVDRAGTVRRVFDEAAGLQNQSVKALFVDRQHGLWAALEKGLTRVEYATPVSRFNTTLNFRSQAEAMARYNGFLHVAAKDGLFRVEASPENPSGLFRLTRVLGISEEVWALLPLDGNLLAGTWGKATLLIEQDRAQKVNGFNAASLVRSRKDTNRVFVGLFDGLASLYRRNNRWTDEGRIEGIHDDVRFLAEDRDGDLWVGHLTRGCSRVDFSKGLGAPVITSYDTAAGLPDEGINVYAIGDEVYFGTESGQLYRFDRIAGRFHRDSQLPDRFGIPPGFVFPKHLDSDGHLWMAYAHESSPHPFPAVAIRQDDGHYVFRPLLGGRFECPFITPLHIDSNNVVWFQSGEDLLRCDLGKPGFSDTPFDVVFRRILSNRDSLIFDGAPNTTLSALSYDLNSLRIEFAALSFDETEKNRYRYRLEEFDERWSPWSPEPHKEYTNLPEGRHRLWVQARNVYGIESRPALLEFHILPPWFRTWWSYTMYVLLILSGIYGGFQWRLRLLRRRNEELERNVERRTRELESASGEIEAQRDHLKSINLQLEAAIRDLKETQSQLVHSEKMASVGHMVAGLAHEINNPLTFIIPNLDYIRRHTLQITRLYELFARHADRLREEPDLSGEMTRVKMELDEVVHELDAALQGSINGSQRIKDIVTNLKKFTRHDVEPMIETEIEPHLDHAIELFFTQHRDVTFLRRFAFNETVFVDIQDLNQCFINILINGVQAIRDAEAQGVLKAGTGTIILETSRAVLGGKPAARILFSDNGVGIPAEILNHIFDPFFTTRPVGLGRGLGLAEAYAIVKKHDGHIDVQSESGRGTRIAILIPSRLRD